MDPELGIPGLGTYAAPGWGGSSTTEPTYMRARTLRCRPRAAKCPGHPARPPTRPHPRRAA